jgi:hypothetical protein
MTKLAVAAATSVPLLLAALSAGCASKRVMVPPRLDLQPYGSVGLVTFTVENAKGSLHDFATQRFAEEVLAGQSGIELLELGNADSLVRRVGETSFGPASAQALGEQRDVPAVFVGHLKVSNVKPSGGIIGLQVPFVQATVTVDLMVRLVSTRSGGTLWRSSASASQKVGSVAIVGGIPEFSAKDPNDAYGELVNSLVWTVTHDLRPTWRRQ